MEYKINLWWENLSKKEQNVLIELLYNLQLKDIISPKGEYKGLLK